MELFGVCNICGKTGKLFTCQLCGRLVCAGCFDSTSGVCRQCCGGRRYEDGSRGPLTTGLRGE